VWIVRIKTGDAGVVRADLEYVQRRQSGQGDPANSETKAAIRLMATLPPTEVEAHHCAENAAEIVDLKPLARHLVRQMESDVGTKA
jgi:hypothetical protein